MWITKEDRTLYLRTHVCGRRQVHIIIRGMCLSGWDRVQVIIDRYKRSESTDGSENIDWYSCISDRDG